MTSSLKIVAEKLVVGVDPGQRGAIAAFYGQQLLGVWDMPIEQKALRGAQIDCLALLDLRSTLHALLLQKLAVPIIALERVSARPGQGVATMFSMGESYGIARLFCSMIVGARIELVVPVTWKKALKFPPKSKKAYSLTRARALFPDARPALMRAKDEGRAEALLIAEYARRFL